MDLPKHRGKRPHNALSAAFVRTAKPGYYCDGNGLYLRVDRSGVRRWEQRLRIQGRNRTLGLGGYRLVSLAEAREKAFTNRKIARSGGDPRTERHKVRDMPTFAEAAARVLEQKRPGWRSGKHPNDWISSLRAYAFPELSHRPVGEITTADILAVLTPIWHGKHVTARRVRQRIGAVMKWAVAMGLRPDNPAGDVLDQALGRHRVVVQHMRALPHSEVAGAIEAVRTSAASDATKLTFEFMVLTACRSGEVRVAGWDEIDLEAGEWTVPGERMKAQRPHRVPLSGRAMEILGEARTLGGGGGLVFPSSEGRPLSGSTLSTLLRGLRIAAVPHGFRSSFRDWCGECSNAPREVAEAVLAHVVRDKVEAAYARSDLFERRRVLMDNWAAYLAGERLTRRPNRLADPPRSQCRRTSPSGAEERGREGWLTTR